MFFLRFIAYILLLVSVIYSNLVLAESNDDKLSITAGYQYTQGKYSQDIDTVIHYVPVSVLFTRNKWRYELTVPYIATTGGNVIPGTNGSMFFGGGNTNGIGGIGMGNNSATTTSPVTNSGLGDIFARMVYSLDAKKNSDFYYELEANIKFGTADASKALGTGENDYALGLNTSYGTTTVPYFNIGYKIMGDSALVDYNNVVYATAGVSFTASQTLRYGFSFDYQQTTVNGLNDFQQANIFYSWLQDKNRTISFSVLTGLTDSSPDFGAGIYITNKL